MGRRQLQPLATTPRQRRYEGGGARRLASRPTRSEGRGHSATSAYANHTGYAVMAAAFMRRSSWCEIKSADPRPALMSEKITAQRLWRRRGAVARCRQPPVVV